RPPTRPALGPSLVASRPMTSEDRSQREPEPAEGYPPAVSPAPEQPPGERSSQYAQHKKPTPRLPIEGGKGERGGVPVPAGLGRPQRVGGPSTAAKPGPTPPSSTATPAPIPRAPLPPHASQTEPVQARTPTPTRISPPGAVGNRFGAASNSGVVMTRPAVIVGAPAKSVGTVPRIRKAREDEGRGFGQGLISEKSLDEVILAYLSEDADEK
ncbi:MAG TPA: hypothetical protein VHN14_26905, partial [Kofleriaceae bacterium]|nr:hypothetical protein [Kofleriaceae bacterium]